MVSPNELTEEQMAKLMNNPEVVKTLDYEEMGVFELSEQLSEIQEADNYEVFTEAVADRSGRVTEQTVKKVIRGMIEEANEYDTPEETEDEDEDEDEDDE